MITSPEPPTVATHAPRTLFLYGSAKAASEAAKEAVQ